MAVTLPILNTCCCLSLRVGSLIVGYISIALALFFMGIVSVSLYVVVTFVKNNEREMLPEHTPEEITAAALSLYITHGYLLLVYLFYFVIGIFLIVGVHTSKPIFLKIFFNSGLILLASAAASVVVSAVFLHFSATIVLLWWCVVIFYCLLVVRSAYLEIEKQNNPSDFQMQNLYIAHRAPLLL